MIVDGLINHKHNKSVPDPLHREGAVGSSLKFLLKSQVGLNLAFLAYIAVNKNLLILFSYHRFLTASWFHR